MSFSVERELAGRKMILETGKMARQADGAVTVQYGDTMVLVSIVTRELKEKVDFFPLVVDYREQTSAAGKIPGGFFKREGRPTTKETLTMRLIDRSIRPLFPETFQSEIQIVALVLSADQQNDPDIPAMIGASTAILMGGIPCKDIIASVRVGRVNNQFILNPTHSQLDGSELDIVVSGTKTMITMVEALGKEVPEDVIIEAIFWGHRAICEIIDMQKELGEKCGILKKEPASVPEEEKECYEKIHKIYYKEMNERVQKHSKKSRTLAVEELQKTIEEEYVSKEEGEEGKYNHGILTKAFDKLVKTVVRDLIKQGKRVDGRGFKDIRPIHCEVGLLPKTHGSALFTRGETQALVTATLGTSMDEQIVDGLLPEFSKRFMLHYNFLPFSVGEIHPLRSPGRREIGHGVLAERSLDQVLPDESRFPYTIRIVSDILESNGSSSMATVCGGTLCLMDAGVPIKKPVAGIAMGLVKEEDSFFILSDICGEEDHYGDMDFKVAGTQRGITALQMDIKTDGITKEIVIKSLEQAREGRINVLREMMIAIDRPRRDISPNAPRVVQMQIPPEKISNIIGIGGKTIRGIQEKTGATVEVENDGKIWIYSQSKEGAIKAREIMERLTEEAKIGKVYKGRVTSVKDFGAFVEIIPGTEGLVHVSELAADYVKNVTDVVKVGDEIWVKVIGIDNQNRIKLSKRAALREIREKRERGMLTSK